MSHEAARRFPSPALPVRAGSCRHRGPHRVVRGPRAGGGRARADDRAERGRGHYCAPSLYFEGRRVEVGDDLRVRYLADVGGGLDGTVPVPGRVRGQGRPWRRQYDVEAEGKAPDFVLEVLSRGTLRNDTGRKVSAYAALGVREYSCSTRRGNCRCPTLHGYRLSQGSAPRRLAETELPNRRLGFTAGSSGSTPTFWRGGHRVAGRATGRWWRCAGTTPRPGRSCRPSKSRWPASDARPPSVEPRSKGSPN